MPAIRGSSRPLQWYVEATPDPHRQMARHIDRLRHWASSVSIYNAICTMMDRLSKERHYASCTATEDGMLAEANANTMLNYVFRHHGLPSSAVLDHRP